MTLHWSKYLPDMKSGIAPIANSIENLTRKLENKEMQIIRKAMRRGYKREDILAAMLKAGLRPSPGEVDEMVRKAWEGLSS